MIVARGFESHLLRQPLTTPPKPTSIPTMMKRFLKNLVKSFGIAAFTGLVTLTICVAIVYLGGFEYGNKHAPEILRNVGILTLVMLWPLFLAQLITFRFDDIDPEEEDDTLDEEKVDPDLEYFREQMLKGLRTPEEIAEDVKEDISDWEDEGGAL